MRWDMKTLKDEFRPRQQSESHTPEDYFSHHAEAKKLLEEFPEHYNAADVIAILLIAAEALGSDRVVDWDIQKAAKDVKGSLGSFDLNDLQLQFYISSD